MSNAFAGHARVIEYLNAVMRRQKIAHAYLFYGPENVGKFTVAKAFAKTVVCLNANSHKSLGGACNECAHCQSADRGTNPDVLILDPEHTLVSKKEERKDIPIADIRELKRSFSFEAAGASWRVAIINQAERMNQAAANAFLKILEEPGGRIVFILVSHRRDSLLPTIVSRSQQIRFSLVPDRVLSEFLKHRVHDNSLLQEIVTLSAGRPGVAVRMLEDAEYRAREQKFRTQCDMLFGRGDIPGLFRFSERVAPDKELRERAILHVTERLRELLHQGGGESVSPLRAVFVLKQCSRIASILETTNVNPRLAMDVLLLEVQSAKIKMQN